MSGAITLDEMVPYSRIGREVRCSGSAVQRFAHSHWPPRDETAVKRRQSGRLHQPWNAATGKALLRGASTLPPLASDRNL